MAHALLVHRDAASLFAGISDDVHTFQPSGEDENSQHVLRSRWRAALRLSHETHVTALQAAHVLAECCDNHTNAVQVLHDGSARKLEGFRDLALLSAYIHAGPWIYRLSVHLSGSADMPQAVVRYLYIAKRGDGSGADEVPYGRAVTPGDEHDQFWDVRWAGIRTVLRVVP